MAEERDIPSLTLRVLENIQAELVGLRVDIKGLDNSVKGLDDRMGSVEAELKILNSRFENFLQFVGKDVQELKERVTRLEKHAGLS